MREVFLDVRRVDVSILYGVKRISFMVSSRDRCGRAAKSPPKGLLKVRQPEPWVAAHHRRHWPQNPLGDTENRRS